MNEMIRSREKIATLRTKNISVSPPMFSEAEKKSLIERFHPDYNREGFSKLSIGPNRGYNIPTELCALLEGKPLLSPCQIDLNKIDYDVDVLVIGGGGAGATAAIEAKRIGASCLIVTKHRMGDSNTVMAEGGIQACERTNDSSFLHFLDSYGGSGFTADRQLVSTLVQNGPKSLLWLTELGVIFDRSDDGKLITTHGGGTSRMRVHSSKDTTGAEIMRVLRDEVKNLQIPILEHTAAIELCLDPDGSVSGAIAKNLLQNTLVIIRAKAVILATGGIGRIHCQGYPTTNHYGATADGLVLGYRAGARMVDMDSLQYHPTGTAYPLSMQGELITEKARSLGAKLLNVNGDVFVSPLETRDTVTSAIIREIHQRSLGVCYDGQGAVWLDTPMIDMIHGNGTLASRLPSTLKRFLNHGIDIRKEPILVYPTLHYQNGGFSITTESESTEINDLFIAGELAGGIHGRNRLMGNALLDIIVFGRLAGRNAAIKSQKLPLKQLSLDHIKRFNKEIDLAGISQTAESPRLFPDYTQNHII